MHIRSAEKRDRESWERMRQSLWLSEPGEHGNEIEKYFSGKAREPLEVFIAFNEDKAIGFIELSIRAYAKAVKLIMSAY
jgi:hypothetical protein